MATGDLVNNIRKMKTRLKSIKYSEEMDVAGITEGSPKVYLPIYHYAFTSYSPVLAEMILSKDIELYGKSDSRFMEAVYKVLRDIFVYKPPITKDQFFAKGFVERKVIMCTEILDMVKKKNSQLNPAPSRTAMKTSVRPKSAEPNLAVPKSKPGKTSPHNLEKGAEASHQLLPRQPPQVVNELLSLPSTEPVRHVSHSTSNVATVRHIAGTSGDQNSGGVKSRAGISETTRHVTINSPPHVQTFIPDGGSTPEHLRPIQECFNTPSIKKVCTKSVEVVTMPRRPAEETLEPSILEIQAPTSDSVLHGPVASSQTEVLNQVTNLYQTVQTLTNLVYDLNSQLNEVKNSRDNSDAGLNRELQQKLETVQSQISNLAARMTLMENRISIIEAKAEGIAVVNPNPLLSRGGAPRSNSSVSQSRPTEVSHHSEGANQDAIVAQLNGRSKPDTLPQTERETELPQQHSLMFSGPGSSFVEELKAMSSNQKSLSQLKDDFSLNYSPIRKVTNGVAGQLMSANEDTFALETEDDARRSSTPTQGGTLADSSLHCNFSDRETNDMAFRINDMLKETMKMMKCPTASSPADQPPAEKPVEFI